MKILIYIIALFVSFQAEGQSVKYKDIVPMIEGTSDEYAMDVLKAFLIKNLDHPAANLKIGSLYLKIASQIDPLIEFEKLQALGEQANKNLFKAELLINDKEIKKHDDYYFWIAKQNQVAEVTPAIVNKHLLEQKESVSKIINSLPKIYTNFTKSVDFYDRAVKNFMEVSSSYPSLKNLYLLYDDKLDKQFSQLKSDYDSSLVYFRAYKSMTDTFALKGYNQSIKIKPINVFRYDGLVTQINFLTDKINVWDYGTWVDEVRVVVKRDIADLRTLLKTNEERQNAAILKLSGNSLPKEATVIPVDKSLVFNLLRFDYNNPIIPLLKYKESKQKLLIEERNSTYFDTANIEIARKLLFYNKMVYQIKESDSLISQFKNRFNAVKMAKYQLFLDQNYNGIDGSSQYMASEKNELRKELAIYGKLLQEGVESIQAIDSIGKFVRYRKISYPMQVKNIDTDQLVAGVPFTTHILEAPEGGYYLLGQYKPDKKLRNTKLYLIKLTTSKKLSWFKNYDVKIDSLVFDSNNYLAALTLTNEGIALLVRSKHLTNKKTATTLFQVLIDGHLKSENRIATNLYPRSVLYNEEQNSFVICSNGENSEIFSNEKNNLELQTYNSLGELSWTYSDTNTGAFVGIIKTEKGYLIARNSITLSKPKVLLTKVDFTGAKGKEKIMDIGASAPIQRIYKLNDASIHLLGDSLYQMINAKLEKMYP